MIGKSYNMSEYQKLGSMIFQTITMFLEGKTVTEICKTLNLSRGDVYKILKENNYSLKPKKENEDVEEIINNDIESVANDDCSCAVETTETLMENNDNAPVSEPSEVEILRQFEEDLTAEINEKNNFSDLENVDEEENIKNNQEEKELTELDILRSFEENPNKEQVVRENLDKLINPQPKENVKSNEEFLEETVEDEESTYSQNNTETAVEEVVATEHH